MTRDACARAVAAALEHEPRVQPADVFWPQGIAFVSFDPGLTDEARIREAPIFAEFSGDHHFRARPAPQVRCC